MEQTFAVCALMAKRLVSVSMDEALVEFVDRIAEGQGSSRSSVLSRLVEERREANGRRAPVVMVDGRRFVPARKGR